MVIQFLIGLWRILRSTQFFETRFFISMWALSPKACPSVFRTLWFHAVAANLGWKAGVHCGTRINWDPMFCIAIASILFFGGETPNNFVEPHMLKQFKAYWSTMWLDNNWLVRNEASYTYTNYRHIKFPSFTKHHPKKVFGGRQCGDPPRREPEFLKACPLRSGICHLFWLK